jgi:hypothetical protein
VTLVDIRDEAISQIKAAFAKEKSLHIDAHPGQFTESEIKQAAQRTPAILTSLVRVEKDKVHFVNWVLYRASTKDLLYNGAVKLVSALMPVIRNLDAEWSIDEAQDIVADCLFSGSLDAINITLWAVHWTWQVRESVFDGSEGGILFADLENFEGYDSDTVIGEQHIDDSVNLEAE